MFLTPFLYEDDGSNFSLKI